MPSKKEMTQEEYQKIIFSSACVIFAGWQATYQGEGDRVIVQGHQITQAVDLAKQMAELVGIKEPKECSKDLACPIHTIHTELYPVCSCGAL